MSLVRLDPSFVTVEQSFIVSEIVNCPDTYDKTKLTLLLNWPIRSIRVFKANLTDVIHGRNNSQHCWAHFDPEDDYRTGCLIVSHCQQQSYSGPRSPGRTCSTYLLY